MKEFRTKDGPFPLRLHYETREIDDICLDALKQCKLLPREPGVVKIDLFLEKYFDVPILYEDMGEGIMGSTVFNSVGAVTGFTVAPKSVLPRRCRVLAVAESDSENANSTPLSESSAMFCQRSSFVKSSPESHNRITK